MNITRPVYYKKQELLTIREHLSSPLPHLCFFWGRVRVAHLFSFLYCLIMCLYVLSSMLCCPLCYPHKNDGRFIFAATCLQEGSCLIYVICVCLCIVVSNTYCVVFLFVFVLCTLCFQSLSIVYFGLPHWLFSMLNVITHTFLLLVIIGNSFSTFIFVRHKTNGSDFACTI